MSASTNLSNGVTITAAPPPYSVAVGSAPKYTPKKDFSRALGELQGRYGSGGGAPVLNSKDEKSKPRSTSSASSLAHKFCIVKTIKNLVGNSSSTSTTSEHAESVKKVEKVKKVRPPPRVPSPALRIIDYGPTLSYKLPANSDEQGEVLTP